MIYRINISLGYPKRNVAIHAHPAWPFVVDERGEPTYEFKVVFVEKDNAVGLHVYKKLLMTELRNQTTPCGVMHDYFTLLEYAWPRDLDDPQVCSIVSVDKIEDLRTLG